jgi:hypothetical protein
MVASRGPSSNFAAYNSNADERILEIAEILAVGLSRLEARKSSRKSADFGESSLHFTPDQSGDAPRSSIEAHHD